jgi:hypothetical protein
MSGEFGSYNNGYFHTQMETAAYDCTNGRDQLTKLWGKFLHAFVPVAEGISYSEAYDSGPDDPIVVNIRQLKALRAALDEIEDYLRPYERVMQQAVREYQKDQIS